MPNIRSLLALATIGALVLFVAAASAVTFTNSASIAINDAQAAGLYPSTITLGGFTGTITDIDVSLEDVSHTNPDDVDILLVGPTGASTLLMSDACGTPDLGSPGRFFTFDDAAVAPLPDNPAEGSPCTNGTYDPSNFTPADTFPPSAPATSPSASLANFNGTNPNGTWSLYVVDDAANSASGSIANGWSMTFTTTASGPHLAINAISIAINDRSGAQPAAPYPSTIAVSGLSGTVSDVNATLFGVSHTFPDDIDILLAGPSGANTLLISDACGGIDVSGFDFTFDDAAAATLPDNTPACAAGTYNPTNYLTDIAFPSPAPAASPTVALSNFNGTDPNGTWSLYVVDDLAQDAGTIGGGWSLDITVSPPTAVEVAGLRASRLARGIALSWRTASEANVAGFELYRGSARIARLAAKRAGTAAGALYRYVDRRARPGGSYVYRLKLIRPNGSRVAAGSVLLASSR
jgi:subtilisin-like proprotein convertase family protein